jgi:hypothetical protein
LPALLLTIGEVARIMRDQRIDQLAWHAGETNPPIITVAPSWISATAAAALGTVLSITGARVRFCVGGI